MDPIQRLPDCKHWHLLFRGFMYIKGIMPSKKDIAEYKKLARIIALRCVRNTSLEDIHSGHMPETKTGDFSDVKVIDAGGREYSWNDVSRISDDEMKKLMKEVVNLIYEMYMRCEDPEFQPEIDRAWRMCHMWDEPELPKR